MKIYQVGGSIRDELLGQTPKDKDWLVVGSSPEEMINKGVEHSDVYYMLGEVFKQKNENSEAIKYLLKALSYKVHSPYVYESLGQCYRWIRRNTECECTVRLA